MLQGAVEQAGRHLEPPKDSDALEDSENKPQAEIVPLAEAQARARHRLQSQAANAT